MQDFLLPASTTENMLYLLSCYLIELDVYHNFYLEVICGKIQSQLWVIYCHPDLTSWLFLTESIFKLLLYIRITKRRNWQTNPMRECCFIKQGGLLVSRLCCTSAGHLVCCTWMYNYQFSLLLCSTALSSLRHHWKRHRESAKSLVTQKWPEALQNDEAFVRYECRYCPRRSRKRDFKSLYLILHLHLPDGLKCDLK